MMMTMMMVKIQMEIVYKFEKWILNQVENAVACYLTRIQTN